MNKAFTNFTWEDSPSTNTPLSAENLNKINTALNTIDNRVVQHETDIGEKSVVSVSASGTATDEVQYITIDGTEKKLAGGGSTLYEHDIAIFVDTSSFSSVGIWTTIISSQAAVYTESTFLDYVIANCVGTDNYSPGLLANMFDANSSSVAIMALTIFAISSSVYFSYKGAAVDSLKEELTTTKIYGFRDAVHQIS